MNGCGRDQGPRCRTPGVQILVSDEGFDVRKDCCGAVPGDQLLLQDTSNLQCNNVCNTECFLLQESVSNATQCIVLKYIFRVFLIAGECSHTALYNHPTRVREKINYYFVKIASLLSVPTVRIKNTPKRQKIIMTLI